MNQLRLALTIILCKLAGLTAPNDAVGNKLRSRLAQWSIESARLMEEARELWRGQR